MMHCPDWKVLLEHRFDPSLEEPEDWPLALEHLERCEDCRIEAYAQDPSLLFLDLPSVEVADADIRQMQQAVATLRQGLELAERDSSNVIELRSRRFRGARVAASLAVAGGLLAGAVGFLGPDADPVPGPQVAALEGELVSPGAQQAMDEASETDSEAVQSEGDFPPFPSALPARWQDAPVVEEVGGPLTRVYSYPTAPGEKIALVMVIDPALDV